MKKVIVDMDGTLFLPTDSSEFFMQLSQQYYEKSINAMKINQELLDKLKGKEIIILTGRNEKYYDKATKTQLKDIQVKSIITCPKDRLVMDWKKEIVKSIRTECKDAIWYDNEVEDEKS